MRSATLLTAAFAAAAVAKPVVMERDYFTEYDVVTEVVTVTAGSSPLATEAAAVTTSSAAWAWTWGHGGQSSAVAATSEVATSEVATSVAPTTTDAPATSVAPTSAAATSVAASSSEASVSAASATTSAASSGNTYSDHVVTHHNIHRTNHSAADVTWSDNLASIALQIAQGCSYGHNTTAGGGGYGQNIAAGAHQDNVSSVITEQFYNDEMMNFNSFYGEATPSDMSDATFDGFGHFTQIVWKGTTSVGCATYDCTGSGNGPNGLANVNSDVPPYFTVCNYEPAGNYLGEFNTNVVKPLGNPVVDWNYGL